MDDREFYDKTNDINVRLAGLEAKLEYIRKSIDEIKARPCRMSESINTNRKMIAGLFMALAGVVSYLTGIKFIG